ncbi:predicted protein [Sclerotinia sclerotiorum 1980 UF-70]|uniref:Uncharacterized protein n=1 Tax=Sclerotinia sclerotiorum (strain ATCC 18683 / 1980 / Ss-1) TaxID=665079 RepID=A7ELB2_SCLS1|nr:predicted protein [Sclerotinia sclerotiorum 1980 UF-70]EDO03628.1 predicted protein [Sclerotinia sclerotiorum 1980 UF-70]
MWQGTVATARLFRRVPDRNEKGEMGREREYKEREGEKGGYQGRGKKCEIQF